MSFPAYEHSKDSGWPWIGDLPSHWDVRRLKTLFSRVTRPVEDGDKIVTAFRDGQVTLRENRREEGFTNALQEIGYQGVRRGDLVIHAMDGFAGAIGVSDSDGKSTPVYTVCVAEPDASARYYALLLRHMALSGFVASLAKGIRERSTDFRWADASVLALPHPPLTEQVGILAFLDREIAKIDALVEAQRRLIELLKEKRQAVISHAVTKGLDPSAPMKDSGVEWLGQVPAHWEVVPTRSLISLRRELVGEQHGQFDLLSLTLRGVVVRDRESGHGKFPAEFNAYQTVRPNDLVFCLFDMDETPRTVGLSEHNGMVTGAYDVFEEALSNIAPFIYWLYLARDFRKQLRPFYTGLRKVIRKETFGSIPVALPPKDEREAIVGHLRELTRSFDELSAQAEAVIALLLERRAALISAAVTGKIDVRGLAPQEAEAA
ncbi:restriction endonuclease subunit S [Caulobacter hibisci]|uniref:Restriction endonuclease subunit S n=1 Tax=Caulobacter hibisci TaxID=2035993 RepID=A0ABS0T3I6_9CAUL|nr:restriction endonuclease subunit S [Caulobacter hibisci]MBI1686448.1 restriction endonuclease subunit S [Caulobacter hibisci]